MILVRFTIDNHNRLIFYGNMAGYVKEDTAVVDEMFQTDELSRYLARMNLTPQWKEGIFDRLAAGETPGEELGQPQKGCRIRQRVLLLRPGRLPPHPVQPKSGADGMYRNDHVGRTAARCPAFALPQRGRGPPSNTASDLCPATNYLKIIFTYRRNVLYEEAV